MAAAPDVATYKEALILLGTAGVVVPLVHKLKVSPILAYLVAGVVLGPHLLGALASKVPLLQWVTVQRTQDLNWLGELGVVALLFLIGIELSFQRLYTMRKLMLGLGVLQVLVASLVIGGLARLLGVAPSAAMLIGLALALSSTAIGVEILSRQDRLTSSTGRATFAVLLLQDLAVVPILFLVGILTRQTDVPLLSGVGSAILEAAVVLTVIVVAGMFLLRPLFRLVAATGSIDLFTATALFVAVGTSVATAAAGMSMALGAFVAGLLLAETEFRRAIEAVMEPFKGLLLGVFFFSVGMSIDLGVIIASPILVIGGAVALVLLKAALFYPLARISGLSAPVSLESALLLCAGGEFAFIILGLASAGRIIPDGLASSLLAMVALSMAALPVIAILARRLVVDRARDQHAALELAAEPPGHDAARTIVVGYGRVGELVASMLAVHKEPFIAVDSYVQAVVSGRNRGAPVYYGDAKSTAFLHKCGVDKAKALIITINGRDEIDRIVTAARALRPELPIIARAKDAAHAQHLYAEGVMDAVPETIEASLQLSEAALVALGVPTGPVIASIHEKRDEFRAMLKPVNADGTAREARGIQSKRLRRR